MPVRSLASARAVASFQAIQASSAHLTRAGYFETPGERDRVLEHVLVRLGLARDCISSRNSSLHPAPRRPACR